MREKCLVQEQRETVAKLPWLHPNCPYPLGFLSYYIVTKLTRKSLLNHIHVWGQKGEPQFKSKSMCFTELKRKTTAIIAMASKRISLWKECIFFHFHKAYSHSLLPYLPDTLFQDTDCWLCSQHVHHQEYHMTATCCSHLSSTTPIWCWTHGLLQQPLMTQWKVFEPLPQSQWS